MNAAHGIDDADAAIKTNVEVATIVKSLCEIVAPYIAAVRTEIIEGDLWGVVVGVGVCWDLVEDFDEGDLIILLSRLLHH